MAIVGKVSAEEKLSSANWELEAQSLELQRALSDIQALNTGLQERVRDQVERLERAFKLKRYLPPDLVEAVLDGRANDPPNSSGIGPSTSMPKSPTET